MPPKAETGPYGCGLACGDAGLARVQRLHREGVSGDCGGQVQGEPIANWVHRRFRIGQVGLYRRSDVRIADLAARKEAADGDVFSDAAKVALSP